MNERDELAALRRLAELEAKAGGGAPATQPASMLERGARGHLAPYVGAAQTLANTVGYEGQNDASSQFVQEQKQAQGGEFDMAGLVGQSLNPINLLASRLGPAVAGGVFGATTPVEAKNKAEWAQGAGSNIAIDAAGGYGVNKVAQRVLSPAMDAGKKALIQAGVNLTPGQRGGTVAKTVEAIAERTPVIGNIVKARRTDAIEGFNRKKGADVLEQIGQKLPDNIKAGHDLLKHVGDKVSNEYNRVLAAGRAQFDGPMMQAYNIIKNEIAQLPPTEGKRAAELVNNYFIDPIYKARGRMSGQEIQKMVGQLRSLASDYNLKRNPLDGDIGQILNKARQALIGSFERHSAPQVAADYRKVRSAYADLVPMEKAAAKGSEGVFDPQQLLTGIKDRASVKRKAQGTLRGQQDAEYALSVLGKTPKPSDNMGLGLNIPTALGGTVATFGGVPAAVGGATVGSAYTRPGMALVNALLNRTQYTAPGARDFLQNYGGSATAALAEALRQQQ